MLVLKIAPRSYEYWDPIKEEFRNVSTKGGTLLLNNCLAAIAQWESKTHKSYFSDKAITTQEEFLLYVRCMDENQNDKSIYEMLGNDEIEKISKYLEDDETATRIYGSIPHKEDVTYTYGRKQKQVVTSELIYARMFELSIPIDCETWNINRLLMLIKIMSADNDGNNKMSAAERNAYNRALNAKRQGR